jgi:hypothetical protein
MTRVIGYLSQIVIDSGLGKWKVDGLKPDQRIVTKLPLVELWDEEGTLPGGRVRQLNQTLIRELMQTDTVQFIVAACGMKLNWIAVNDRFRFWKTVRSQIADPSQPINLKQFPNETAYIASEWRRNTGECLILLEAYH